jgi:hypothetical protein
MDLCIQRHEDKLFHEQYSKTYEIQNGTIAHAHMALNRHLSLLENTCEIDLTDEAHISMYDFLFDDDVDCSIFYLLGSIMI